MMSVLTKIVVAMIFFLLLPQVDICWTFAGC